MSILSAWRMVEDAVSKFPHRIAGDVEGAVHKFHVELLSELEALRQRVSALEGNAPAAPTPSVPVAVADPEHPFATLVNGDPPGSEPIA